MDLGVEVGQRGGATVATVHGDVDFGSAPRLREALVRQAAEGDRTLVVDLSDVPFIDSTGLGVLVAVLKRFRTLGGDLVLVVPAARVRSVFELTGLDRAFTIVPTVDDAVVSGDAAR